MSNKKRNRVREFSKASDYAFHIMVIIVSVFSFLVVAYPLYFIVIASISNSNMVNQGKVIFLPRDVNVYGYKQVFADTRIWAGYANTILYTIAGTFINIAVTLPAAYALSFRGFRMRKVIMPIFVFTMFFNGGIIPTYMVIRNLHLINTVWIMIIIGALNVYNLIITRSFIESSIPGEFYEAAIMDGCSHFKYFFVVVIPLSKAVISVIFLYYAVGHWNDFFSALLYINSDRLQPLQVILRNILISNQAFQGGAGSAGAGAGSYAQQFADQIKYAVIIVSTVPILCIYPFIQKYFAKGVMIGGIKG